MMEESGEATSMCIYAQIDTQEMPIMRDLADYWEDPSSFFLVSGVLIAWRLDTQQACPRYSVACCLSTASFGLDNNFHSQGSQGKYGFQTSSLTLHNMISHRKKCCIGLSTSTLQSSRFQQELTPTSCLDSGALLKEAIEDMEWAAGGGTVTLTMQRNPPSLAFSAHGPGNLEIRLQVGPTPSPPQTCLLLLNAMQQS